MFQSIIHRLRIIGFVEGTSMLVLLFIAMPLKYLADSPAAVKYVGWAHGILFMLYMAVAFQAWLHYKWPFRRLVYAFIAAFLPFGTFVFDRWLKREEERVEQA